MYVADKILVFLLKLNLLVDGKVLAEVYNAFQKYFVTKETRNVFQSDFIEIFCVY